MIKMKYYLVSVSLIGQISLFSGYTPIVEEKVYADSFEQAIEIVKERYRNYEKIEILNAL